MEEMMTAMRGRYKVELEQQRSVQCRCPTPAGAGPDPNREDARCALLSTFPGSGSRLNLMKPTPQLVLLNQAWRDDANQRP